MAVNWDDFTPVDNKTPVSPAYRPADVNWDAFTPVNKQNTGIGGDTLTGLKIGLERLPGMVTGLADVPIAAITDRRYADEAGDYLGKATGFQPAKWSKEAEEEYSPKYKASQAAVDQVWKDPNTNGWDVAGAYLTNPRMIGGMVAENAPQLLVGGVAGRGVLAAANKLAPLARVAPLVGEDLLLANKARDAAMTTRDIESGRMQAKAVQSALAVAMAKQDVPKAIKPEVWEFDFHRDRYGNLQRITAREQ